MKSQRRSKATTSLRKANDPQPSTQPSDTPVAHPRVQYWIRSLDLLVAIIGLMITLSAGAVSGLATGILVLAATVFAVALVKLWSSLQCMAGDVRRDCSFGPTIQTRGAEIEQKQALLRALKDLEFEHCVGKLSEEDYLELRGQLRSKAKSMIQSLDQKLEPHRAEAERLAAEFLQRFSNKSIATKSFPSASAPSDRNQDTRGGSNTSSRRLCERCSTCNDLDATFCKRCGNRLTDSASAGDDTSS